MLEAPMPESGNPAAPASAGSAEPIAATMPAGLKVASDAAAAALLLAPAAEPGKDATATTLIPNEACRLRPPPPWPPREMPETSTAAPPAGSRLCTCVGAPISAPRSASNAASTTGVRRVASAAACEAASARERPMVTCSLVGGGGEAEADEVAVALGDALDVEVDDAVADAEGVPKDELLAAALADASIDAEAEAEAVSEGPLEGVESCEAGYDICRELVAVAVEDADVVAETDSDGVAEMDLDAAGEDEDETVTAGDAEAAADRDAVPDAEREATEGVGAPERLLVAVAEFESDALDDLVGEGEPLALAEDEVERVALDEAAALAEECADAEAAAEVDRDGSEVADALEDRDARLELETDTLPVAEGDPDADEV